MPCNWSTTASSLLRSYSPTVSARFCWRPRNPLPQLSLHAGRCTPHGGFVSRLCGLRSLATASASVAHQDQGALTPEDTQLHASIHSTSAALSAAQVSRAAAQAVRLSILERNYGDALYVVNSACQSILQGPLGSETAGASKLQPIQFACPVSPRLSAHAFLHGLIRAGYTKKAGMYAKLMIRAGIPIRSKTLESVVSSLASPSPLPQVGPFARVIPRRHAGNSPYVMHLQSNLIHDRCARAAFELLQEARTFGQQRTERMYKVLIETLIMQGEILVASLLFVLLLKDFEVRKLSAVSNDEPGGPNFITHGNLRVSLPSPAVLRDPLFPNPKLMGKILEAIDGTHDPGHTVGTSQSLQSLAIFAMLLDTGQIGHHRVAAIISSMYRYPRTTASVWILRDGKPVRVQAHRYFREVLDRLLASLAADDPARPAPLLSRRSYNALLTYALRHRLSPKLASAVLEHMCVKRERPLCPDRVTYNILLRSGTLLRLPSLSETALAALREVGREIQDSQIAADEEDAMVDTELPAPLREGEAHRAPPVKACPEEALHTAVVDTTTAPGFAGALERLRTEPVSLPESVLSPAKRLKTDRFTLSSYVNHLTATGQVDEVVRRVFELLPELVLVEHPARNGTVPQHIGKYDRRKAVQRAVAHGPYVYAALINALSKAREVGLAERVFILGQYASRWSFDPEHNTEVPPWELTVHAYTAMMQGYARVVHEELPWHKLTARYVGTALLEGQERCHRRPQLLARYGNHGYALFVTRLGEQDRQQRAQRTRTKPQVSRRNAMLLYRSMLSGGRALFDVLVRDGATRPLRSTRPLSSSRWQVKPDARFFNAALDLFAPRPGRGLRRLHSPSTCRRRRVAEPKPSKTLPMLHKLATAMVESGFAVPKGYHQMLRGVWKRPSFNPRRRRKAHLCLPAAYPGVPRGKSDPYRIPVCKTRGLPVRRMTMKRSQLRRKRDEANTVV
ncbi:hypothetical protein C8Q77DRAFT_1165802 [Trametes polyzona]|nr:hypothetical protein C8Q77DRAFT_1165802 [Trametes polyzona]